MVNANEIWLVLAVKPNIRVRVDHLMYKVLIMTQLRLALLSASIDKSSSINNLYKIVDFFHYSITFVQGSHIAIQYFHVIKFTYITVLIRLKVKLIVIIRLAIRNFWL